MSYTDKARVLHAHESSKAHAPHQGDALWITELVFKKEWLIIKGVDGRTRIISEHETLAKGSFGMPPHVELEAELKALNRHTLLVNANADNQKCN
jgi:hypothetical protein